MSLATLIEINDSGIQVFQRGVLVTASPGYAVLNNNQLLIGHQGAENSRRLPRWTNNKYWSQLNTDAIANGTANVRHHADLAFAHLEQIASQLDGDTGQLVFAVPGFYTNDQLALLLGMANECQLNANGLVDSGLVAVATPSPHSSILHLDIHLHRVVLSVFKNDGLLRRTESITVAESGLFTLWDRWANIVADQFIQSSRFDPMYQAESEQVLYDQLPGWIKNLGTTRTAFDLAHKDANYSVVISPDQLVGACATLYPQIIQAIRAQTTSNEKTRLCVSHRFSGFPGLSDSLALLNNLDVEFLPENAVARGAEENLDKIIQEGQVAYVTTLPLTPKTHPATVPDLSVHANSEMSSNIQTETEPTSLSTQHAPTHLLLKNHATSIGQTIKLGGISNGQLMIDNINPVCRVFLDGKKIIIETYGSDHILVNDKPVHSSAELHVGDELAIDSDSAVLIFVD
jgi:hypothetical protein